jgi:hypothetical protein
MKPLKNPSMSQVPVAHACNPSYLGGRDQEIHGSKPAQANNSQDHISKIPNTNQGWQSGSSDRVSALRSRPSTAKKKKERKKILK